MKKLVSTLNLSRDEWLKYRKQGIGGSDAGAICGLNPYTTAMHVYYDKTSETASDTDSEAMRQGRDLEDYVARRFMEASGKKVRRANAIFCHEDHPFMLANVDRMVSGENVHSKTAKSTNTETHNTVPLQFKRGLAISLAESETTAPSMKYTNISLAWFMQKRRVKTYGS